MPWDTTYVPTTNVKPARSESDDLRTDSWSPGEAPLLRRVPTSSEVALLQAQSSLIAAVTDGNGPMEKRLRLEVLPPGLNKIIENSHAYSEPLLGLVSLALAECLHGLKVETIFPSAGTMAAAQASFKKATGRLCGSHVGMGAFKAAVTRDLIAEGFDFTASCVDPNDPADVYLIVSPTNSRGDAVALAVQQAVEKCPSSCFVLLNPDLEDTILSYTFGIHTSDAVRSFVQKFETCYYYRGIFQLVRPSNRPLEKGCLLHHYKQEWVAHGLLGGEEGFGRLATFGERPSREQLGQVAF